MTMPRVFSKLTCGLLFVYSLFQAGCAEERGFLLYAPDSFHYLDTASTQYLPAPPVLLRAQLLSENLVNLDWKDVSLAEWGFIVTRTNFGTAASDTIAILPPNTISCVDTAILLPGTFYYSIASLGRLGRISSYTWTSVSFSMPAPALSFVETGSFNEVMVQWSHATSLAAKYVVERKSQSPGDTAIVAHPLVYITAPANQHISSVDTSNTYWFRVRSLSSALSNQIHLQFLTGKWTLAP